MLLTHSYSARDVTSLDDIIAGGKVDDGHTAGLSRERFDNLTGNTVDNNLNFLVRAVFNFNRAAFYLYDSLLNHLLTDIPRRIISGKRSDASARHEQKYNY